MLTTLTVRKAALGDLDHLGRLFDDYRQFYEQLSDLETAKNFVYQRLQHKESIILVASNDAGNLVGFCQLYPTFCSVAAASIYVLYDLYVAPTARQLGIGKALLQAAHKHAIDSGVARMDLSTARTNVSAQALYESLGWKRDEVFYTYSLAISA